MSRKIPDFDKMKNLYPGKGYTVDAVKQLVGADVNSPDVKNTCVVRLSVSLNKLGDLIPARTERFKTRRGKDKHWYGLRVTEFWDYLIKAYGQPTLRMKAPLSRDKFLGSRGIIGFRVGHDHFNDATGHFTLWDGDDLLYGGEDHNYWDIAYEAALWESGDGIRELAAPV
jgi:hypothetical protein